MTNELECNLPLWRGIKRWKLVNILNQISKFDREIEWARKYRKSNWLHHMRGSKLVFIRELQRRLLK